MFPNDNTKYYLYLDDTQEYLYDNNGNLQTTSNISNENQGWVFNTKGDKITLQSTAYNPKYLGFADSDGDRLNIDVKASAHN